MSDITTGDIDAGNANVGGTHNFYGNVYFNPKTIAFKQRFTAPPLPDQPDATR